MERSSIILLGGAIVAVIAIAAVVFIGSGISGPGAGQGYGPGPQGGQGPGAGAGPGSITPTLLPMTDTTSLSETERSDILFMREEEQLAHDLYVRWAGMYAVPIFSNIAASETQHVGEVQLLIDRYNLENFPVGNASFGYYNATIQSLYAALAKQGDTSLTGALEAGLAIEEQDIADLDRALADTTRSDITRVYSSLRQGSENHKSAFLRQLGR